MTQRNIEDIFSFKKRNVQTKQKQTQIIIDTREKNALVKTFLYSKGARITTTKLEVGDYKIGDCTIERKTESDLMHSLTTLRFKEQLRALKQEPQPLLIIESNKTLYHQKNKNVYEGLLIALAAHHHIPVIHTHSEEHTADTLIRIAKKAHKHTRHNAKKIPKTTKERQLHILEAFPGIGPKAAQRLLDHYGSLKNIFRAPHEEIVRLTNNKVGTAMQEIINYERVR